MTKTVEHFYLEEPKHSLGYSWEQIIKIIQNNQINPYDPALFGMFDNVDFKIQENTKYYDKQSLINELSQRYVLTIDMQNKI